MRIAWVVPGSLDQVSGGYIYDRMVVAGLRARAEEVDVLTIDAGTRLDARALGTYDAIVADELGFAEIGPLFRALTDGPLRVLLVHHLTAWEPSSRDARTALQLERVALHLADVRVATSRTTAKRLVDEGLARDVEIAEPGADRLPNAPRRAAEPGSVRLLFVGNLIPRKRVLELLGAFERVVSPGLELAVVGDSRGDSVYAAQLRNAIGSSVKLSSTVRLTGSLGDAELAAELSRADALVLPSALEGYGMVLSEALFAGVPVITADAGAARELVEKTAAGLVFQAAEPAALEAALAAFAGDAGLRDELLKRAARARDDLPRWHDTVTKFQAMLGRASRAVVASAPSDTR